MFKAGNRLKEYNSERCGYRSRMTAFWRWIDAPAQDRTRSMVKYLCKNPDYVNVPKFKIDGNEIDMVKTAKLEYLV